MGRSCDQRIAVRQGHTLVHCRVDDLPAVLGCLGAPSGCSKTTFGSVNFGDVAHDLVTCALDVQLEIAKKAAGAKIKTLADGLSWMRRERLASSAALRPYEKLNVAASAIRHPMDPTKLLRDLKELLSNGMASDASTEMCSSFDSGGCASNVSMNSGDAGATMSGIESIPSDSEAPSE